MMDLELVDLKSRLHDEKVRELLSYSVGFSAAEKMKRIADQYGERASRKIFGVEQAGQLLGVIGFELLESSKAIIHHISVAQDKRGSGIGRSLIEWVIKRFSITQLIAETDGEAAGFYRHCGFQVRSLGAKTNERERFRCEYAAKKLDNMIIEKITDRTIGPAYKLCSLLKEQDEHPCAFWGYSKEDIEKSIGCTDKIVLIAMTEGAVIGIGALSIGGPFQDHWAAISVAIHPGFRKSGVGKKLVLALEECKNELNIKFIKALILENNVPSRRLFASLGYEHKATLYHDFKIEKHGYMSDCVYYKVFSVI